ncbi:hypothetical protein LJB90_03545 [Eubacteriales bacterium OttesenSCG-928-G02]|nr:hypothetical protein [Eubacteriales bacterium OttesenSCG-928-G02]
MSNKIDQTPPEPSKPKQNKIVPIIIGLIAVTVIGYGILAFLMNNL